jgi:predicted porin
MNKKLISLAVAAALAAPAAAMAEATIYGRVGVSLDYQDVTNAIPPTFATVPTGVTTRFAGPTTYDNNNGAITLTSAYEDSAGALVPWELMTDQAVLETNGFTFTDNGDLTPASVAALANVRIIRLGANGKPIVATPGQDFSGWGVNQNAGNGQNGGPAMMRGAGPSNRFGLKGSEDLGNGLKAIYQIELGVNFAARDNNILSGNNGGVSIRNSFVGLAGSFGTALIGRHDTPLKISTGKLDLFSDTMADYNGTVGFDDIRADNAVAYISPSFSGFSFMGALVAPGGATANGAININSDSIAGAYSLAAIYNNGPFYASAAYESLSNEMFMDSTTSLDGSSACVDAVTGLNTYECSYVNDDYDKWRFGLGLLDWNGFTLTAIYENQDNLAAGQQRTQLAVIDANGNINIGVTPLGVDSQQLWQVQGGYAFGNNMFKAMYGAVDRGDTRALNATRETLSINNLTNDLAGDKSTWAVGFDHNFSKRTQAYVLYTAVDDDNDDNILGTDQSWSGFSIGMVHKF